MLIAQHLPRIGGQVAAGSMPAVACVVGLIARSAWLCLSFARVMRVESTTA